MAIRQLSVFAENKNGAFYEITKTLAAARVDIRAFSVADTSGFGVVRLLVSDLRKAAEALSGDGKIAVVNDVIGVKIPDTAGGLYDILRVMAEHDIGIDYLYAFTSKDGDAYVVIRVEDNARVEEILTAADCTLLTEGDIK